MEYSRDLFAGEEDRVRDKITRRTRHPVSTASSLRHAPANQRMNMARVHSRAGGALGHGRSFSRRGAFGVGTYRAVRGKAGSAEGATLAPASGCNAGAVKPLGAFSLASTAGFAPVMRAFHTGGRTLTLRGHLTTGRPCWGCRRWQNGVRKTTYVCARASILLLL